MPTHDSPMQRTPSFGSLSPNHTIPPLGDVMCGSRWGGALEFVTGEDDMEENPTLLTTFAQNWRWELHKFGGSSMSDIKNVSSVLENHCDAEQLAVVVSAMGGVTDQLFKIMELCKSRDNSYIKLLECVVERHLAVANKLLADNNKLRNVFVNQLMEDSKNIQVILRSIFICRNFSIAFVELITGYGELWSSLLLSTYLQAKIPNKKIVRIDARDILVIKNSPEESKLIKDKKHAARPILQIDWDVSSRNLAAWKQKHRDAQWLIITGYICSTSEGIPTTLKRNGSDFSAAIFGALLKVRTVTIWTDVTGVYSTDPRKVKTAVKLKEMTYEEASELAYFGGKVIHPSTMTPCMTHSIPLKIRSSFCPEDPGTKICQNLDSHPKAIRCFSAVNDLAILTITSGRNHKLGTSGMIQLVYKALQKERISIVLVTQASFEHSFRFCVSNEDGIRAKEIIEDALLREITLGDVKEVALRDRCSIVAGIGEGVVSQSTTVAKFFTALGNAKINVLVISQGSGDRSIAVVVAQDSVQDAIKALHNTFYPPNELQSLEIKKESRNKKHIISEDRLRVKDRELKSAQQKIQKLEAKLKKIKNNQRESFPDKLDIDSLDVQQLRTILRSIQLQKKKKKYH